MQLFTFVNFTKNITEKKKIQEKKTKSKNKSNIKSSLNSSIKKSKGSSKNKKINNTDRIKTVSDASIEEYGLFYPPENIKKKSKEKNMLGKFKKNKSKRKLN